MTEDAPAAVAVHAESAAARANAHAILAFFRLVLSGPDGLRDIERFVAPAFIDSEGAAGPAGVASKLRALWAAFPDGSFHLLEIVAAADRVATRSLFRGSRTGRTARPAGAGADVTVAFADFYRLEDGRIVEHAHVVDSAAFARSAGAP